jgi:hypothetical protein
MPEPIDNAAAAVFFRHERSAAMAAPILAHQINLFGTAVQGGGVEGLGISCAGGRGCAVFGLASLNAQPSWFGLLDGGIWRGCQRAASAPLPLAARWAAVIVGPSRAGA